MKEERTMIVSSLFIMIMTVRQTINVMKLTASIKIPKVRKLS